MPINLLLARRKLSSDEIDNLNLAFDQALRSLNLVDRNDPLSEIVAKKIIEVSARGVRDATEIANVVVSQLDLK